MLRTNIHRPAAPPEPPTIALSELPVGALVNIGVNATLWAFIVVHQGKPSSIYDDSFNDGTILLMRDLYESRNWNSLQTNDYKNSEIQAHLNNDFYALIDTNIQSAIKNVKIPYCNGIGTSYTLASGANGLEAKVWLLSHPEMGLSKGTYSENDGAMVSYFSGLSAVDTKRISTLSGTASAWWLRSCSIGNKGQSWYINIDGGSGRTWIDSTSFGIRPTLVLPNTLTVSSTPNPDGSYNIA
jgi:hypothetical protein